MSSSKPQLFALVSRLRKRWQVARRWLTPGLGIKRWVILSGIGVVSISLAIAQLIAEVYHQAALPDVIYLLTLRFLPPYLRIFVGLGVGVLALGFALYRLNRSILTPLTSRQRESVIDVMQTHSRRQKGLRLVAIGGGTGLPAVLRGFKKESSNITAIVTVADDGGSSGALRRELGVLPPGDLRNNIAALANDEDLMTQLFQYRFDKGGLEGHSLGNLFITALADITGSMDRALIEAGRVLVIDGRVLPATVQDVTLMAEVRSPDAKGLKRVAGESQIPNAGGKIERVFLVPENARAYPDSIRAILNAELIVIGPGSLYTSILPNLLVNGIPEAIRASHATCIYVCNIATQQGETDGFTVADHVLAIERHIGRGVFRVVLANNAHPTHNAGEHTRYVPLAPPDHEIRHRYVIHETDLTDPQRPWRHSPAKLSRAIQMILSRQPVHQATSAEPALPVREGRM